MTDGYALALRPRVTPRRNLRAWRRRRRLSETRLLVRALPRLERTNGDDGELRVEEHVFQRGQFWRADERAIQRRWDGRGGRRRGTKKAKVVADSKTSNKAECTRLN